MALPPHLMNLQQKLNSMNLPKMPINNQQNIPENNSDNIISKNSLTQTSLKREKKQKLPKHMTKKWKTFRKAAGTIWEDPTLDEWPDNDYRIFCGDLGNEVSDQILANAFSKYQSLQKAKVIRDKNTGKSKGYGFVSLLDVNDYIKAMREMNGKYVGNRPIKIKRSNWKDRSLMYSKSKVLTVKFKRKKNKLNKKKANSINQNISNNANNCNSIPLAYNNVNSMQMLNPTTSTNVMNSSHNIMNINQ